MSTMCALCAASYHFSEFRGNTGVHFYTFLPVSTPTECSKHSNAVPNAQQILRNEQLQNGYPSLISSQSHIGLSTQMSTPALQEPVLCPPETQRSGLRASKIDTWDKKSPNTEHRHKVHFLLEFMIGRYAYRYCMPRTEFGNGCSWVGILTMLQAKHWRDVKYTAHLHLVPRLRMNGTTPLLLLYALMACTKELNLAFFKLNK